ncbi:hypothetical protein [Chenggangzhangella methanolivorans]|uniref:Uncharacterized protein n=1 Tax=Chenggangzhangella methanolivorans TaxID=1437009 RepID=A0A9E6R9Q1_9HYPH|nr:hypothetical protein [Chenggangzhangella methanolivorans]QZN99408.1 hypothetical protein K6K41_22075 [Chenggangzhangella methanolivorans]
MTDLAAASPSAGTPAPIALVALTGRLVWSYGPQLAVVATLGLIARELLIEASVALGFLNRLAGLTALTLVVLAHLVMVVALYETARPGLPSLEAARTSGAEPLPDAQPRRRRGETARRYASAVTLTLAPFFAIYAAWGFLADAVRDYSKHALALTPFGESGNILDVSGGAWLAASVALAWAIRRFAKHMRAKTGTAAWDWLIVTCEALWAFIGLFVISNWKNEILAALAIVPETIGALIGVAKAAGVPPPIEQTPPALGDALAGVFFYALYPLVQLTIAALIYGYDVHGVDEPAAGRGAQALARWRSSPKAARDFVGHFVDGLLKRYRAIANGVRLTLTSGVALIATAVVLFRLIDWLSAWAWSGAALVIGPHELREWQALSNGISLLFGTPSAPGDGVLVTPLKICLLAATIEIAFSRGARFRKRG